MSRLFQAASAAAVGLTVLMAVAVTVPGLAQDLPGDIVYESTPVVAAGAAAAPIAHAVPADLAGADSAPAADPAPAITYASLREAVAATPHREPETDALRCIAAGVFYESQSETLEGQLAVAHVIINRAGSGRFAATPCGVLTQRGQFSFVRGGVVPTPPPGAHWQTAVAIARIATASGWPNAAPGAMFFHAARVSPGWSRPRIARLGNHIFYR